MADELTHDENLTLDMLGADLKGAILAARHRTGDASIMASIAAGLVIVRRGEVEEQPQGEPDALAHLNAL